MPEIIAFTKVKLPGGWLGNMAPYPVTYGGKEFRTTEALFQCYRFAHKPEIFEEIRAQKSPMAAKMIAKKHRADMLLAEASDIFRMRTCLRLKIEQHPELREKLLETGDALIVEDCTNRDRGTARFWGAVLVDDEWQGRNMLGKLWMELRADLREE